MANQHTHHNPQEQDALFTTPVSLMLDARLTPLDRNGWQVLRMLRTPNGHSPLATLGQLRRYLTSTPLGQRAGYETALRVLVVLRLTGWISLVGQHRDPLSGQVLSQWYQVHEKPLMFPDACALDASLSALLQSSIGHENNQVDRVALHVQETLMQASEAAPMPAHAQRHDDDDLPPTPPSQQSEAAGSVPLPDNSVGSMVVLPQTAAPRQTTVQSDSTYKTYMYKEVRTYRAREENRDPASVPMNLPPCLSHAQAALRRLPAQYRQDVLDELQARSQRGTVHNAVAYFFALVKRVFAGEFRLWAGRKQSAPVTAPTAPERTPARAQAPASPVSRETALAHLAHIRQVLHAPMRTGELAAQTMPLQGWRPCPA